MWVGASSLALAGPSCDEAEGVATAFASYRAAVLDRADALWPGWAPENVVTGLVADGPWVVWVGEQPSGAEPCRDGLGVERAAWVRRDLEDTPAVAQIDTTREPSVAILADLAPTDLAPRDELAIYAHELFHVWQFRAMGIERLSALDPRGLHAAWKAHRAELEPVLADELRAGFHALAGDGAAIGAYVAARRATAAVLGGLGGDLPAQSRDFEVFEGLARYVEGAVETDAEATAAFGGPRDAAETLKAQGLSYEQGRWWYATGYVAARVLDGSSLGSGWKGRVFAEGLDALLAEAAGG